MKVLFLLPPLPLPPLSLNEQSGEQISLAPPPSFPFFTTPVPLSASDEKEK